jgi:hypothetical protein
MFNCLLFILAFGAYVGHTHPQRHIEDPEVWYLAAQDPLAMEHISALMQQAGVWSLDVPPRRIEEYWRFLCT